MEQFKNGFVILYLFLLLSFIILGYFLIRKYFKKNIDSNLSQLEKILSLLITISAIIIIIFTFHTGIRYNNVSFGLPHFIYLFYFISSPSYLIKIISFVLIILSIFALILLYKKNKILYSAIPLIIGAVGNWLIYYDLIDKSSYNPYSEITFLSIILFLIFIVLNIILFVINKKKHSVQ